jgi:hypothetical protein
MPSPVQIAVETYVRMAGERDPAVRAQLLDACFAQNGRMVTRSRELRGRKALAEMFARAHADPEFVGVRVISAIDAQGTTFRYRAVVDRRDGTAAESFDAGEIDADGRICLLLTFAGPLEAL